MSLKSFLMGIFPKFFNAAEVEFNKLPKAERDELISNAQFGQIIKQEFANGYQAVVMAASTKLALPVADVNALLIGLCKKFNVDPSLPANFIDHLQAEVNKGLEDSSYDALWTTVSGQIAIIAGGGTISWPTVAIGLIQFVYTNFVKGKV